MNFEKPSLGALFDQKRSTLLDLSLAWRQGKLAFIKTADAGVNYLTNENLPNNNKLTNSFQKLLLITDGGFINETHKSNQSIIMPTRVKVKGRPSGTTQNTSGFTCQKQV